MFLEPDEMLKEMLEVADDEVAQLQSTCYGLADAPREWYKTARKKLL